MMNHVTTAYGVLIGYSLTVETGKTENEFDVDIALSAGERGNRT